MTIVPGQKYRHHTGEIYEIVRIENSCVIDACDIRPVYIPERVTYRNLEGAQFTMPLSEFCCLVVLDWIDTPRFTLIGEVAE